MVKPTTLTIEETRQNLSEIARRASIAKERFVVTFHGKPLCAVVPLDDLEGGGPKIDAKPAAKRRTKR